MLRFGGLLARRAALLAALLVLVFALVNLLPGDAARSTTERGATAADVAARRAQLGLDRPLSARFGDWIGGVLRGDLGSTARGESVGDLVGRHFVNTLLLTGMALLLTVVAALLLGVLAASRAGRATDRGISGLAIAVLSLPEFVVAELLVLVFASWLHWLPAVALIGPDGAVASPDMVVLPVLALALPQIGWNTRVVRAAVLDAARAPHVETAHLDGLSPRRVLLRHVLPGALPTIAVSVATSVGVLFGGAVVVETVFNYPGVGAVLTAAVQDRDAPLVAGVLVLTGAVILAVLLVADTIRAHAAEAVRR
ncbi:ABC transporter permease [Embleya sp. AB8]|uniref:ABC transporter permease n=1 Tax=Embleya sp. AB8 TaxID=3156304 RepID=UPI003C730CA7